MKTFLLTFLPAVLAAMFLAAAAGCCQPDPCKSGKDRAERSAPYHQHQK